MAAHDHPGHHAGAGDSPGAGPLAGVRVIEMGSFIAGPFCGQLLADLGADVVKIEPPGRGDVMRQWGATAAGGASLWWPVIGRNKRSLTLDLRRPKGQRILHALVRDTDVVVENFRPGTLEGWGLSPEALRQENPGLVVARVSGFGQSGPASHRPGFGAVAEAMAGLRILTGDADRDPARVGISIGDSLAGLFAALGVVSALLARPAGGGRDVDVSIAESVLAVMESVLSEHAATGTLRERSGSILRGIAPSNLYPTRDGRPVLIAANADGLFRALAEAMGQPELARDPRFADHSARGRNQSELDTLIAGWSATRSEAEIMALMERHGIPAGPLNDARAVIADPHFRARGAVIEVADPDLGAVTMQGAFPRLSRTQASVRWTGRRLGADTDEILGARLAYPVGRIAQLRQEGVI